MTVGALGPSLFMGDFVMGDIALCVTSELINVASHCSSAFFGSCV
jgi:hypothetical protein